MTFQLRYGELTFSLTLDERIAIGSDQSATFRLPTSAPADCALIEWTEGGVMLRPRTACEVIPHDAAPFIATPGRKVEVSVPSELRFDDHRVFVEAVAKAATEGTATLARKLFQQVPTRPPFFVHVLDGATGARRTQPLLPSPARIVVGRGEDCAIQLQDTDLSRRHAAIESTPEGIFVVDLHSKNGTRIDGNVVAARTLWALGATIQLGASTLTLRDVEIEPTMTHVPARAVASSASTSTPDQPLPQTPSTQSARTQKRIPPYLMIVGAVLVSVLLWIASYWV